MIKKISNKNLFMAFGLSVFLVACSTTRHSGLTYNAPSKPETTTELGVRYLLGRGVPQDDVKAFSYFSKAANDDDPFAQNEVAYLYASGKGTPQNNAKAFMYYQKAAKHGLASAQYNLGLLYLNGIGTEPNKTLALQWFQKSAGHGFEPAREALEKYR